MTTRQQKLLATLRIALGWLLLYAGLTKLTTEGWSAAGFLTHAQTFSNFYASLAEPGILPFVNFVNVWGQILLGSALILGVAVRWASIFGVVMMALYYFPGLDFPKIGEHSYLVDEHVIYALALLIVGSFRGEHIWSAKHWFARLPFFSNSAAKKLLD